MAPERCFGYTYQNGIVAFPENCQENQNGASRVGTGDRFWLHNRSKLPKTNEFPVTDLQLLHFPASDPPGLGTHTDQTDGPMTAAGFGAATTSPGAQEDSPQWGLRTAHVRPTRHGGSSRPASRARIPFLPCPLSHPKCPGLWPNTPSVWLCTQPLTQEPAKLKPASFHSRHCSPDRESVSI